MSIIRNDLVNQQTKKEHGKNLSRWRSLDPMLLLASLALSVCGICAVYVAAHDAPEVYAMTQAIGFVVGLAGAIPLAVIDYRVWQRSCIPYTASSYSCSWWSCWRVPRPAARSGGWISVLCRCSPRSSSS